jgi:hypothetical protein
MFAEILSREVDPAEVVRLVDPVDELVKLNISQERA